jgi:RimJ/RimL family protein N-acetyltransferase
MIPRDITNIIASYACEYILKDWINMKKISWDCLSMNTAAIHILEKNLDKAKVLEV